MDLAYMEHTEGRWGAPIEFQLAATNWTAEGPAGDAQAWASPAAGHPLECASIVDIFGSSCSLQPYVVPSSGGQQQLVEYNYYNYYAAAAQQDGPDEKATTQEDLSFEEQMRTYTNNPMELFQKREEELDNAYDAQFMKQKMHRYPPSIRALNDDGLYTVPRVVAIGPYHHFDGDHLKEAEKVKHVAAGHCIKTSRLEVQVLYQEVVSAVEKISGLYDKDVMAGMGYEDEFLPMMFYDACFLVMYMLKKSGMGFDRTLYEFFESNNDDIAHDIMLLENQIPWPVVDAVMNKCSPEPSATMKTFIAHCKDGCLLDRVLPGLPHVDLDKGYKPPHLLGLLRFYVVGKRRRTSSKFKVPESESDKIKSIQTSTGAIELAEMGIFLTANETTDEIPANMGLDRKWCIFAKLSIAPLCLNDLRASMLVNMAALELCTTPDFFEPRREDSAVCSYLRLLCMLVHREEDVHELRTKGILQGAGLTNKKALDFFTSLHSLRKGRCYADVMVEIEGYRMKRWGCWLWLYKFIYKNWKIIAGIVSALSAFASILGTLMKLKGAH